MNLESKEDKLLLAQLADKQRQCEQRQYPVCSDFLDPRQQALAQVAFAKRVACCFWGGYAEAERRLREALLQDDRVLGVEEFRFARQGRSLAVSFLVRSVYGDLQAEVTNLNNV